MKAVRMNVLHEDYTRHRSGLYLPFEEQRRPTCIDLFCGCGGFSLGVMQAGFEVVAAVDWEPDAMFTYMLNLGSYPINIHYVEEKDSVRMEKAADRHLVRHGWLQPMTAAVLIANANIQTRLKS